MSAQILLVTARDETHRKPLLESEGYAVQTVCADEVHEEMKNGNYQLVLMEKDGDAVETIAFCDDLKRRHPCIRIAIIAQRAEYVPASPSIDAVIRQQHSPRMFLSAVKKLLERSIENGRSRYAGEGK